MPAKPVATVTAGKFGVSVTTGDKAGAILHVYRFLPSGKMMKGEGYGRRFNDSKLAWQYALQHGYCQVYYRRIWCTRHRRLHTPSTFCRG